jgi:predicted ATP-grasp superfamily ATP-dependent carboligase
LSGVTISNALPTAIVLGVDTPIGLTVVRELGRHEVPVVAIGRSAGAIGGMSRFAKRMFIRPTDRSMADWLPEIIRETGASALFAISEGDLLALAELPPVINGCRILTPRLPQLDIVLDKSQTMEVAKRTGLLTPDSWQPLATDDISKHVADLAYPVVLKWSDPPRIMADLEAAGIPFEKVEYAATALELLAALRRYEPLGHYPLVQSYCRGHGVGQMLLMQGGNAILRFQHQRLREYPASGGVSTLCASIPIEEHSAQMEKSEALLRAIGWEGTAMVEYRFDPNTGSYWLMEINGRFWGSLPLASQCGAEFAWEQYRSAVLRKTSAASSSYSQRHARYLIPDTRRLFEQLQAPNVNKADEIFNYIADFFDPGTGYYVWSWRDPGPLLTDAKNIVRRLLRLGS